MMVRLRHTFVVALVALCACVQRPPADVQSSVIAAPDLYTVNPADIAVMPVEDATPDRRVTPHLDLIRQEVAKSLVGRLYSPLTARAVDAQLATDPLRGTVTDATLLGKVAGRFGEDAVLGLRITQWDESKIMATNRIQFSADVTMVDAKGKRTLWSGNFTGDVKAGGSGPAPLDRDEKVRSAAIGFAQELISRLPSRKP